MDVPKLSFHAVRCGARALWNGALWRRWTLGGALHEQIALRVSALNGCAVCFGIHQRSAGRFLDGPQIAGACSAALPGDLPPAHRAALRFAAARTRRSAAEPEAGRALEEHFTPAERRAIAALVDLFTFNNRFNNTWETLFPGARRRREALGMPTRE